jgi:hypothetical protein
MSKQQRTAHVLFFPCRDRIGGFYFICDRKGIVYEDLLKVDFCREAYRNCWGGAHNGHVNLPPVLVRLDEVDSSGKGESSAHYPRLDWGFSETDLVSLPLTPAQAKAAVERLTSNVANMMMQPIYDQSYALFFLMGWTSDEKEQMQIKIQQVLRDACVNKLTDSALAKRSKHNEPDSIA